MVVNRQKRQATSYTTTLSERRWIQMPRHKRRQMQIGTRDVSAGTSSFMPVETHLPTPVTNKVLLNSQNQVAFYTHWI